MANHLNVLVVKDDKDTAIYEALLLAMENHQVRITSDSYSAVREARATKPDIVLLDLNLPSIDGFEIARQIREMDLAKRPVLIAVTNRTTTKDFRQSRVVGIDMHL